MGYLSAIFYLVIIGVSADAVASSVYVNDQLRVGVRPEPSQVVAPIGVVLTGMKLKVLDRQEPFIKIRTDKGLEGWIKDIYVTKKVPAILQLKDIEKKQQHALSKISDVEKTKVALEEANAVLNDQIVILKTQREALQRNNIERIVANVRPAKGIAMYWLFICIVLGFAAGYFWHRYQSMKRLGGLRI